VPRWFANPLTVPATDFILFAKRSSLVFSCACPPHSWANRELMPYKGLEVAFIDAFELRAVVGGNLAQLRTKGISVVGASKIK
jgi:hypothetical protein